MLVVVVSIYPVDLARLDPHNPHIQPLGHVLPKYVAALECGIVDEIRLAHHTRTQSAPAMRS